MSMYDPYAAPGTRFATVRFREGYDSAEVDAFLARCDQALAHRDGSVTAADVQKVRFSPVRRRDGYTMDDVDAHLDRTAAALADLGLL